MSLPNYLAKIKSAGIYRFVWDKSQVSATEAETLRLVVGYSEKGPFNTPVYIDNPGDFKTTFGDVNKKLERRGCFFHRMALQALTSGPILALNLKKFDGEKVNYIAAKAAGSFDLDIDGAIDVKPVALESAYNTMRFWTLDPDNLPSNYGEDKKYVILTSADSKEVSNSIIMRGCAPSASYDVTIATWYKSVLNEDIPEYFEGYEDMLVSDFFAEIYVFKGQFTPALATSEELKRYFNVDGDKVTLKKYITNAFGEKVDTLVALADNECSNFIQKYQGILLPYFKDSTGAYISLDLLFNGDIASHKMMMKLNGDLLDDAVITPKDIATRGWDKITDDVLNAVLDPSITPTLANTLCCYNNMKIVPTADVAAYSFAKKNADAAVEAAKEDVATKKAAYEAATTEDEKATAKAALVAAEEALKDAEEVAAKAIGGWIVPVPSDNIAGADLNVYTAASAITDSKGVFTCPIEYEEAGFVEGDRFLVSDGTKNVVTTLAKIETSDDKYIMTFANEKAKPITHDVVTPYTWPDEDPELVEGKKFIAWFSSHNGGSKEPEGLTLTLPEGVKVISKTVEKTINGAKDTKVYKYIIADANTAVRFAWAGGLYQDITPSNKWYEWSVGDAQFVDIAPANKPSDEDRVEEIIETSQLIIQCGHIATELIADVTPIYIEGYTRNVNLVKPANNSCEAKLDWQKNASLNAAHVDKNIGYPGIVEALTNRTDIDYRYIVDTWESYVDSECKASLAALAKKKDNCLLLTNFPAAQSFIKCKIATFTDDKGNFQVKYVVDGANRKKSAAKLFSLPSIDNGASWCSFNTPVIFTDGTVKTVVPAAALVSNNFMEKYNSRQPYYIVAGPNYGRLSYTGMVGPDFNYSQADRDLLEPFGVNCTVYVPRKGTYISSNQTAKQTPVTALSKINVRELVIYLQDQIEDLLQNYQWEFNTQTLRDLIKKKADTICENVKYNGGIYEFSNQCDENNNTDDVINAEMLVLSTSIEPGMGAGKMVQELTIYKKGGMSAVIK